MKKVTSRRHLWIGFATAAAMAGPAVAQAQMSATFNAAQPGTVPTQPGEAAEADTDIREILVTARRRSEDILRTPVSVLALQADDLINRGITRVSDLQAFAPGLQINYTGNRTIPTISIRGQRRNPIGEGAPAVLIYKNEVPLPIYGSLIPTFDVNSLQVLKGPQGTLFGRNATAGAILVYTAQPVYGTEGYVASRVTNYNGWEVEGAVNAELVPGAIAVRVAGMLTRRDGYTKNLGAGRDLDAQDDDAIRVSLLIEPGFGLKNVTVADYYHAKDAASSTIPYSAYPNATAGGGNARLPALRNFFDCGTSINCDVDLQLERQKAIGIRKVYIDAPVYSTFKVKGLTNTTTLEISKALTFKNIFGYQKVQSDNLTDLDGTPLRLIQTGARGNAEQITNEFQSSGTIDIVDWVAGAFYLKDQPSGIVASSTATLSPGTAPPAVIQQAYRRTTSKALYGQVGVDLAEFLPGVKVNAGIRQTWDDQGLCSTSVPSSQVPRTAGQCAQLGQTVATKFKATTWTLGLDWQVSNDLFAYVASRRGYRAGGNNTPQFSAVLSPLQYYAPETITDVEAGVKAKGNLGAMPFRVTAAIYRGWYKGIQRNYTLAPNFDGDNSPANDPINGLIVNSGKAILQGGEMEAHLNILPDLQLSVSGAYTDAHYTELKVSPILAAAGLIPTNAIKSRFPNVPEWSYGAAIEYTPDLGHVGKLLARVDFYHSDEFWMNERPAEDLALRASGYNMVNARLGLREIAGSRLDLSVFATNMFNENYVSGSGIGTPTLTLISAVYGPPRIYGLEARVRF